MLFGVKPAYDGAYKKPFIKDERYVKAKGGKKRLAKNLTNRGYYTVGYPELRCSIDGKLYYNIWQTNGGRTHAEALAYLEFQLAVFKLRLDFYNRFGKLPTR